jgi:hypothetical protein
MTAQGLLKRDRDRKKFYNARNCGDMIPGGKIGQAYFIH